jgi:hypothetical protein
LRIASRRKPCATRRERSGAAFVIELFRRLAPQSPLERPIEQGAFVHFLEDFVDGGLRSVAIDAGLSNF